MRTNKRIVLLAGAAGSIAQAVLERIDKGKFLVVGIDNQKMNSEQIDVKYEIDLGNYDQVNQIIRHVIENYGTPDALVFLLGKYFREPLGFYDDAKILDIYNSNVLSVIYLLKFILPFMEQNGGGNIVFVTSQAAQIGGFDPIYASSKGALLSLMKSISKNYAKFNIAANSVSPGPVYSGMSKTMGADRIKYYEEAIPIGRMVYPSEVADVIFFLLDSDIKSINGASIDVDGGLVRR